ncbi:MAG: type II CAAX endopeptidase family protein [Acidobacteriota bacterium]
MESSPNTQLGNAESTWELEDLGLLLAAILPSLLISSLVARAVRAVAPAVFGPSAMQQVAAQSTLYLLLMGSLFLSARLRHRHSVRAALGLRSRFPRPWLCVIGAPLLAIAVSALGAMLHAPSIPNPVARLVDGRAPMVLVGLLVVAIGPAFEELVFRGFLQPLLKKFIGAWPAVFGAAVPFALIHGVQNEWAWQPLLLIWLAGSLFGAVRHWTGSTSASILLHASYNLTFFTAFLVDQSVPMR